MALDIHRLRSVPMTKGALYEFITLQPWGGSGLTEVNEGHDFIDTIEVFDTDHYSIAELRKQLDQLHSGCSGIGIALHAWLQRDGGALATNYRQATILKLFDAFATKRNQYFKSHTAKVVADVFDYLNTYEADELNSLAQIIVNRSPAKDGKELLSAIFEPSAISQVSQESCLYPTIFSEINKHKETLVWFQKNIPQRLLPYAYNLSGDLNIRSLMDKKSRGRAVELDLGL